MFLKVKAFPDSKKEQIIDKGSDKFWVYVKEPASQNQANEAVIRVLSEFLKIPIKKFRIVKGSRSPSKILEIINQEKLWK